MERNKMGTYKKVNIIGDIHGRDIWKQLIVEDAINVFVGDYFSPYDREKYPYDKCVQNFLNIIAYKEKHPETVLLTGNHDIDHWNGYEWGVSRHDSFHNDEIKELFEDDKELFRAAFAYGDLLVTHSGAGILWLVNDYKKNFYKFFDLSNSEYDEYISPGDALNAYQEKVYGERKDEEPWRTLHKIDFNDTIVSWKDGYYSYDGELKTWKKVVMTPQDVEEIINDVFDSANGQRQFTFGVGAGHDDYYGTSQTHGPMWIRYEGLKIVDVFNWSDKYLQVYGHTQMDDFKYYWRDRNDVSYYDIGNISHDNWSLDKPGKKIMIDCLEMNPKSLIVEFGENGEIKNVFENKLGD